MKRLNRLLVVLAIFFVSGCINASAETRVPLDASPTLSPEVMAQPLSTALENSPLMTPPFTSTLQNLIAKATEDLAQRFSIPVTAITLIEAKAVTWPDSSLGCPQEGFAYSQVLTPGHLIVLESANNRYEYHAGNGPDVIYCPNPQPPVPDSSGNT